MSRETPLYAGVRMSKTGKPVPTYHDGSASHSLYDPEREAQQLAREYPDDAFIVFAGIGGGYLVREYLARHPGARCAVAESGSADLDALASLVDISDILHNPAVTLIADCAAGSAADILADAYVPALHGDFRVIALRSWQDRNAGAFRAFEAQVRRALDRVSADFSVQSHFGKLWFRNILLNLSACERLRSPIPVRDVGRKQAVIAAAGPGLERSLTDLRRARDSYAIFSTDTAFGTLMDSGIVPDFFVSVDAQAISVRHVMHPLRPETAVILDVCGNPDIALEASRRGSPVIFASGGHPLARYASLWAPLPLLDSSSGTVTLAARQAARALGFGAVSLIGADFAYVGGKPYARGTYLDATFSKESLRLAPAETLYASLMFRTPVGRIMERGRISYTTDVLDRYARAEAETGSGTEIWDLKSATGFPFGTFIESYRSDLERAKNADRCPDNLLKTLLPLMAWQRSRKPREGIKLALDLIARYTAVS